jgi:heavy metal translocating P-type ATPase
MVFELLVLGAAYVGAKKAPEDNPYVKEFKSWFELAKSVVVPETETKGIFSSEGESLEADREKHFKEVSLVSVGALALSPIVPVLAPLGFATYVYSLAPHLRTVEKNLREERDINVDSLFFFADMLALFSRSYVAAAFSLVLLHTANESVLRVKDHNRKQIGHLFSDLPSTVRLMKNGYESSVPLEIVAKEDVLVLHAGETIPVDGFIVKGYAGIDQQALTGEAQLAELGPGDLVFANTILIHGVVHIQVERSGADTTANRIAEAMLSATDHKSQVQLTGERWADQLTHPMFYSALVLLPFIGPVATSVFINAHVGMRIRVVAPLCTLMYISLASRKGLLVRDGRALEKFLGVDTILFDKTGTLTHEEPEITAIIPLDGRDADDVLRYAAIAEQKLSHPIAKAVLSKADALDISYPDIDDSNYSIGYGIRVECFNETIQVGSLRYVREQGIDVDESRYLNSGSDAENSYVFVVVDGRLAGALELRPQVRRDAANVISRLRERGFKYIAIVSGDAQGPTSRLAAQLGMDEFFAEVLPEQKSEVVARLQAEGRKVCFVGDGINDSIALKQADVSISLAGASTIAQDIADVVLMDGDIEGINDLYDISAELDQKLNQSLRICVAPGVVNVLGAFVLNFNALTSLLVNTVFGVYGGLKIIPQELKDAWAEVQPDEPVSEPTKDDSSRLLALPPAQIAPSAPLNGTPVQHR